jgi:hypothetical protein
MSMKKKFGALRGISEPMAARRLPSICAMAASVVSPSPSAISMIGVAEPGRWRLARPRRQAGRRIPRRARAPAISRDAPPRNRASAAAAPRQNIAAKKGCSAVAITSATRASAASAFAAATPHPGQPSAPTSRNSAAPGMRPARPSGQSEKASAVSRPYRAAKASGAG